MPTTVQKTGTAAEHLPARLSLTSLREAARDCRACPLWRDATQTVFSEGRKGARVVLVGEQPGDHEDLDRRPSSVRRGASSTRRSRKPGSSAATPT